MDRLPLVEIGGRRIPSTYGLLHAASVDWHGLDFESFATALGKIDREHRESLRRDLRELPTLERFRLFGRGIGLPSEDMAHALTETHMGELRKHVTFVPEHAQLLARLHRRVRLALCSNFSHSDTARAILAEAGLLEHFDALVISMDVGFYKPRPEMFQGVIEALGVAPQELLHVGDSLEADVAGAAGLGIRPIWLTRRVADAAADLEAHAGPRPAHVISDLSELESLVG
jgi:putative hydrolase of the HAD superfamily